MDDGWDGVLAGWRGDAERFRRDVAGLRSDLERELGAGAEAAARRLEGALLGAIRKGSLGFEDLRKLALSVLADIAAAAVKAGIGSVLGRPGGGGPAGLVGLAGSLAAGLGGLPGRATGGPVSPGRVYRVGERGPELFVPTGSGAIVANGGGAARPVAVSIRIDAGPTPRDEALTRSSRQVARAVRRALEGS